MQKNKYNRSFSLKEFCLLVALFIDDIIEKLLEFEFTDFLQEIIALLKDEYQKNVEKSKMSREIQLGENDSYICKLIRDDSIEEFIIFVNQGNISLASSKIKYSICETNTFLMNNEPTLIEYDSNFQWSWAKAISMVVCYSWTKLRNNLHIRRK